MSTLGMGVRVLGDLVPDAHLDGQEDEWVTIPEAKEPGHGRGRPEPAIDQVGTEGNDQPARVDRFIGERLADGVAHPPDVEGTDDRCELAAFREELIPDFAPALLLDTLEDPGPFEFTQALGKPLGCDSAEAAEKVGEAPGASEEIPDDEQRPFLADHLK